MGISTHFYTIWGIRHDWSTMEKFIEGPYEDTWEDDDTPFMLVDGMCGEYVILGRILFDSGDMRYGFENGNSFVQVDVNKLPVFEALYKDAFIKKYPDFTHFVDKPFKLMTLAHYS